MLCPVLCPGIEERHYGLCLGIKRCGEVVAIATDFSVVLFRSDFMLFSEKNRVKAHKNQWVLTMPCPLERLAGATSRGQTMAPEGQKPSQ
jgi:hypothetical protein